MTSQELIEKLRRSTSNPLPLPASGRTPERHHLLMQMGREDLSYARLAEAHWDAVAILAEAGQPPHPGSIYGVWASEIPGHALALEPAKENYVLSGKKLFCSGAGLMERALITTAPGQLVDVDLRANAASIQIDDSQWHTSAFADTHTSAVTFNALPVSTNDFIGPIGFYLDRPGFWHGACGPAACWAGGAAGLVDYALENKRSDPHTLAHLGAMRANLWALESFLDTAGREIDVAPSDRTGAQARALTVRHLVEQAATDVLRRLTRAYGPHPLAMDAAMSRRCHELDLYLRQCHAERDLEALGTLLRNPS